MRNCIVVFLCWWTLGVQAQQIERLRKEFVAASASAPAAEQFFQTTGAVSAASNARLQAYRGAALLIQGKFAKGIEEKKQLAKEGIALLEAAVGRSPEDIEIRTLRLSIQENSPKILKYKDKIEEDRAFVARNFDALPEGALKAFVRGYLEQRPDGGSNKSK